MGVAAGVESLREDVTGEPSPGPGLIRRILSWFAAWLALLPLALLRAGTLAESDTFWQVRTGLLTIQQRAIPAVDPFSWTVRGEPWTLNSWGFNVVLGAAYRATGLPGVALTCALSLMVMAGLVLLLAKKLGAAPWAAAGVLLLASPVLIAWFSARPQLVDYVAVSGLLLLLGRLARGERPKTSIFGIGVLMVVWVNLHSASLLGVGVVGATAVLLLACPSTRAGGYRCLVATAVALVASLANPYGLGLFTQTASVKNASTDVVVEWQHLDPTSPAQLVMLLIGIAGFALAVRRRDAVFTAALGLTIAGSLLAIRILPILVLVAVPVLAAAMSAPAVLAYGRRMRLVLIPGAAIALAALAVLSVPGLSHLGRPDPAVYPTAAVRQIPSGCHLFNSYQLGGYVLLERPDVPVSIDSRNDLYGVDRVLAADRLLQGQGDLGAGLAGADCVLVPPSSGMAQRLKRNVGWRLQTSDPAGALFLRH